jgi:hypothetical protein
LTTLRCNWWSTSMSCIASWILSRKPGDWAEMAAGGSLWCCYYRSGGQVCLAYGIDCLPWTLGTWLAFWILPDAVWPNWIDFSTARPSPATPRMPSAINASSTDWFVLHHPLHLPIRAPPHPHPPRLSQSVMYVRI